MDTSLGITSAEILDALTVKDETPANFKTLRELVKETGVPKNALQDALRNLQDEGRLLVAQVPRTGLDGRRRPVPAYAVLAK